jgi:serine/threonine-protein kinase HipA
MSELAIWMNGQRVGALDGTDRDRLRVTYDTEWLDHPDATPLSLSMPLGDADHEGDRVRAYLWGLFPDNERLLERWARTYDCSASDVFGLLRGVGSDVTGAARYLPPDRGPSLEGAIEPLTDSDVAELLREAAADRAPWHADLLGRWSLPGAQAKIALTRHPTGAWGRPSGAEPTTHILKPAIAGLDHHGLNEHLCLAAAGRVGLRVAPTWIHRFEDQPTIVSERYDRIRTDAGVLRVHQEDGCQALGVHPTRKYEADGGPTIEQLAGVIWDHVGERAQQDVMALVLAVAYNWLVLGTDAHAKNYSFLLSGPQVRLAPLYDIASAATYELPRKLKSAHKIGGEYRMHLIGRRHWERLARTVRVPADAAVERIAGMADALPDAFTDAATAVQLDADDQAAATKLRDAIAAWAAQCRSALDS